MPFPITEKAVVYDYNKTSICSYSDTTILDLNISVEIRINIIAIGIWRGTQ